MSLSGTHRKQEAHKMVLLSHLTFYLKKNDDLLGYLTIKICLNSPFFFIFVSSMQLSSG